MSTVTVVPSQFAQTDGNGSNNFPFNIGGNSPAVATMRYQQLYSRLEFGQPGTITALRFRRNADAAFSTSGINIKINLGYAATSYAMPSQTFATNVHTDPLKTTTVLDTTNLTLSSNGTGSPAALRHRDSADDALRL